MLGVTASGAAARAQDAEKLVDQYIKAEGGSKALSRIQAMTLEGTFTNPADGKSGTYTFKTKLPNRYYSELVTGDVALIEAYNGKSSWHETASGDIATLTGPEGTQLEAAGLYYNTRLVNAKKNKLGLGSAQTVKVSGKDALAIEATAPSGVKRTISFDPHTHLIVREAATVGGVQEEILYDDYRVAGNVKIPYKIELRRGSDAFDITIARAALNHTVESAFLIFPRNPRCSCRT